MSNNGWSNQDSTRVVIVEGGVYTGLFFYSPTIGAGNLVGSWTAQAGTDPYGNPYPAGWMVQTGASRVVVDAVNGLIQQRWITGNPGITPANSALLEAATQGAGNGEWDKLVIQSALNTTHTDVVNAAFFSSSTDGTQAATFIIQYDNVPLAINENYLQISYYGASLPAATITAAQPGTGTSGTNPALSETWHTVTGLPSGWTQGTQAARYRLMPDGTVVLDGSITTTGAGPWPAGTTLFTLPTGYAPPEFRAFVTRSAIAVAAGQDTVTVMSSGAVQNGQTFTASGQNLTLDGVRFANT